MGLKQNHRYHKKRDANLLSCHHAWPQPVTCTSTKFTNQVRPCMILLAEVCKAYAPTIVRWEDRCTGNMGQWNHVAHFDTPHQHAGWFSVPILEANKVESRVGKGRTRSRVVE